MNNLVNFLIKNASLILFLVLQVFCITLIVSYNNYQQIRFFSATAEVAGSIQSGVHSVEKYFALKTVNEDLKRENAALRELLKSSYLDTATEFNPFLYNNHVSQFRYTPAMVVSSTVNKQRNYFIIDKGQVNGIEPDMGVITSEGVAGIVTEVSANFSTVMPLIHIGSGVSTAIKRNGYFGILSWDGKSSKDLVLNDIPGHVELNKGDTLVARGAGGVFPAGELIGFIDEWQLPEETGFYEIKVKPAVDFRKLSHVYVMKNLFKDQWNEIEPEGGEKL